MARAAEMAAPDDRTFTIHLQRPFGPMLETLAKIGPSATLEVRRTSKKQTRAPSSAMPAVE